MSDETDDLIRDAVRKGDAELPDVFRDDSAITEMIVQNFRGRRKWLTIFPMLLSLLYTGLGVWAAVRFFHAETTQHQIAWATGFLVFAISVGLTKIYVWGEWQRNSIAREIKRLELAVADLRDRVGS